MIDEPVASSEILPCYRARSQLRRSDDIVNASEHSSERHRWSVEEYRRMGENGTLAPDARVELIDGEVIDMTPIGSLHAGIVDQLARLLGRAVGDEAIVRVQNPVELSNRSEPEPDLTLLRPRDDFYKKALPLASDVLLAIEVADSTLAYDRDIKRPLYARHGVPEYWLIDVNGGRVLTFRDPRGDGYAHESTLDDPRSVSIGALEGVTVDLSGLFA